MQIRDVCKHSYEYIYMCRISWRCGVYQCVYIFHKYVYVSEKTKRVNVKIHVSIRLHIHAFPDADSNIFVHTILLCHSPICLCMYVCIFVCKHVCRYVCMCVCVCVCMSVCMCVYLTCEIPDLSMLRHSLITHPSLHRVCSWARPWWGGSAATEPSTNTHATSGIFRWTPFQFRLVSSWALVIQLPLACSWFEYLLYVCECVRVWM